jgi:hypothetical protein
LTPFHFSTNFATLPASQPGQSCAVGVTFTPQFVAGETGTLTIYNDSSDEQQSVALSGTGGRPVYP